jgi:chromosome segregation ATPase
MNAKPFAPKFSFAVLFVVSLSVVLLSWGGPKQQAPQKQDKHFTDTVPKKDKKIRDLDDAIDEMDKAELKLNMEKVKAEIEKATKDIDAAKIKMEIDKAMKDVDMEKVKAEIEKAVKEIDAAKIEQDVKASLAKVDWEKMKQEMEEIKKIDMSKVDADMKKVEKELKDLGPKIEKEMEKAKLDIEKAKVEIKEYKNFVDGLEKDGLINKKEDYSIQHKNGELFINGKKQPADVYNKYREFLDKHKKINIKKSDGNFNINNDDDND